MPRRMSVSRELESGAEVRATAVYILECRAAPPVGRLDPFTTSTWLAVVQAGAKRTAAGVRGRRAWSISGGRGRTRPTGTRRWSNRWSATRVSPSTGHARWHALVLDMPSSVEPFSEPPADAAALMPRCTSTTTPSRSRCGGSAGRVACSSSMARTTTRRRVTRLPSCSRGLMLGEGHPRGVAAPDARASLRWRGQLLIVSSRRSDSTLPMGPSRWMQSQGRPRRVERAPPASSPLCCRRRLRKSVVTPVYVTPVRSLCRM